MVLGRFFVEVVWVFQWTNGDLFSFATCLEFRIARLKKTNSQEGTEITSLAIGPLQCRGQI